MSVAHLGMLSIWVSWAVVTLLSLSCSGDDGFQSPTLDESMVPPSGTQVQPLRTSTVSPTSTPSPTRTAEPTSTAVIPTATASPTPPPPPTRTAEPTSAPVIPTATASPTPVPTHTSTPSPTRTAEPTSTAVIPTATSTSTPSATATREVSTATALEVYPEIEFVDNTDCIDGIYRSALSPIVRIEIEAGRVSSTVLAEVADEPHERTQGLMCRGEIAHGTGMLFVYSGASPRQFWMFNTYVPIDIIYLDQDRKAVRAVMMEPCPRGVGQTDGEWRRACTDASRGYGSILQAQFALELPSGWLEGIGIDIARIENVRFSW